MLDATKTGVHAVIKLVTTHHEAQRQRSHEHSAKWYAEREAERAAIRHDETVEP